MLLICFRVIYTHASRKPLQEEKNMKNTAKRMTRFEKELAGMYGAYWKAEAEKEIAKMQARVDNDELRTNMNGGAFWSESGNYVPEHIIELLTYVDFPFDPEETRRAREAQHDIILENYRKNYQGPSEEELIEMRAAFGTGVTVVDVITGQEISL